MGIAVTNLTKRFQPDRGEKIGFLAVDDVSFEVKQGTLVALLGPSGSGKSTILRIIAGLEKPDTGQIQLKGEDVTYIPARKRNVGFVFQHYALFKHMNVWKNIAFGLEVNKWPKNRIQDQVTKFLDLIQLTGYANRYPSQLSGGQRQRVALARALAPEPNYLLLDEPFGALDAKVRRNLAIQLRQLHKEVRTTSVFVTHDQEEAFELADQIVVINRGRVEQIGTSEEIYDHPKSKFVASFIGNVNLVEGISRNGNIFIGAEGRIVPGLKSTKDSGEVALLIRPENIDWFKEGCNDCMDAIIKSVAYKGDRYEINLDLYGLDIRMIIDKTRGQTRSWEIGSNIPIKLSQYSIFDADEGHAALRAKLQSLGYIE